MPHKIGCQTVRPVALRKRILLSNPNIFKHYGKMRFSASARLKPKMTNMGLNKREIAVIAETNRGNYTVEIKAVEAGLWLVRIAIIQPEKHYEVFTSRGDLKTWRNLADAIMFVQETCPDCENVTIVIEQWTFTRRT